MKTSFIMNTTDCKTYLNEVDDLSQITNNFVAVVYIFMSVITIIVNLLLIAAMIWTKQASLNTSNILIMFMSSADVLNGALSFPLLAAVRLQHFKSCSLKIASEITTTFLGYLSSMAIVLLAFDRYLHIRTTVPLRESFLRKLFKRKRLVIPILAITVFSMSMSLLFWQFSKTGYTGKVSIGCAVIALKVTSICTIAIFYVKGYRKVRRFVRTNPIYNSGIENAGLNTRSESTKKEPVYLRSLQKTVALLVIALMATYIPQFATQSARVILILMGKQYEELLIVTEIFNALLLFNSTFNSLIIFKMNKKARSWVYRQMNIITNEISNS